MIVVTLFVSRGRRSVTSETGTGTTSSTVLKTPEVSRVGAAEVKALIAAPQRAIADRQKDAYNALSRLGKAYDKRFTTPIDAMADPSLFSKDKAQQALAAVVVDQMLRMGEWSAAEMLSEVSVPSLK